MFVICLLQVKLSRPYSSSPPFLLPTIFLFWFITCSCHEINRPSAQFICFYIFYKRVISLTTFKMVSVLAKEIERATNLSVIF